MTGQASNLAWKRTLLAGSCLALAFGAVALYRQDRQRRVRGYWNRERGFAFDGWRFDERHGDRGRVGHAASCDTRQWPHGDSQPQSHGIQSHRPRPARHDHDARQSARRGLRE